MQKIIEQLYSGESFLNEHQNVKIAGYKEAKNIAFEAHEVFEDKLNQVMKIEWTNFYLSKQMSLVLNRHKLLLMGLNWEHDLCQKF